MGILPTHLTAGQQAAYQDEGYHFPVRAFEEDEAAKLCRLFMSYQEQHRERLKQLLPRERRTFLCETHFFLRWVYEIVSHPRVLDAVESVLGRDIMVWSSQWFPKFPNDKAFVSWHQDATYWGLTPPNVTTAWVALSWSTRENGCMRVVPGTHKTPQLPQRETYGVDNMLSRGQEIAVEVNEATAVDLVLQPGEFSLHHIAIVHGSGPNNSDYPRIGVAVRYISPNVVQNGQMRDLVLLVRGKDTYNNFEIVDPPGRDMPFGECPTHAEALERKARNLLPKGHLPSST
ncbi:MAG: phytanoyl-CoA dioxygenase family protein [Acidobacteriota bacterium]